MFATQSCLTLCNPIDYRQPGSSVHGISQARILEQVSISFFRGSSQPRDQTRISCVSCIGRQVLSQPSHQVSPRINCGGGQILFLPVCLWQGRSKGGFVFMNGFMMKFIKILLSPENTCHGIRKNSRLRTYTEDRACTNCQLESVLGQSSL